MQTTKHVQSILWNFKRHLTVTRQFLQSITFRRRAHFNRIRTMSGNMTSQRSNLFLAFQLHDVKDLRSLHRALDSVLNHHQAKPASFPEVDVNDNNNQIWVLKLRNEIGINDEQVENILDINKRLATGDKIFQSRIKNIVSAFNDTVASFMIDGNNESQRAVDLGSAAVGHALSKGWAGYEKLSALVREDFRERSRSPDSEGAVDGLSSSQGEQASLAATSVAKSKSKTRKTPIPEGVATRGKNNQQIDHQAERQKQLDKLVPTMDKLRAAITDITKMPIEGKRAEGHIAIMDGIDLTRAKGRSWDSSKFKMQYPTVFENPNYPGTYLAGDLVRQEYDKIEGFDWRNAKMVAALNKKRREWVDDADYPRVEAQKNGAVKYEMDGDTDLEDDVKEKDYYWKDPGTIAKYGLDGSLKKDRNIIKRKVQANSSDSTGGKKRKAKTRKQSSTSTKKKTKRIEQRGAVETDQDRGEVEVEGQVEVEVEENPLFC